MRIWIDVDGIISDFTSNVIRTANEIWVDKMSLDYVPHDWGYSDVLTAEDWGVFWQGARRVSDFWLRQQPIVKNTLALQKWLKTTEHQVFYITSRMDTGGVSAHMQSAQWLIRQNIYPPTAQLIVTPTPAEKKRHIIEYGIDFGIDDLPSTVADLNMLSWHHCYLLSQPYNEITNHTRVQSLQEFLDIVDAAAASHPET